MSPIRINLGAGDNPIDGYDNTWDEKQGKKAYPLELADNSVDELRASHLLEHFGHRGAHKIIQEWLRVLKPGGLLKIAVPDLEKIAAMYMRGEPGQYQGWISGGQVDPSDTHLTQYDWTSLTNLLRDCGLVGIHKWAGDSQDCSGLPISLNVAGYKRPEAWPKFIPVMSSPRLGFVDQFACCLDVVHSFGVPLYRRNGYSWGQCLTLAIESAIEDGADWVLALDYDSIFSVADVCDLLTFAVHKPEADALVGVHMHRMKNVVLCSPPMRPGIEQHWQETYYPILMGHFGCTLIKATSILEMPRPWFHSKPDSDGRWGGEHRDDDRWFWDRFQGAGKQAFLCPRVVIGHCENIVLWPDRNLNKIFQHPQEWYERGRPRNAWR